jgi:hypothetical protein
MKLVDLIAQLQASAALSSEENPEVVLADEYDAEYKITEVQYNTRTDTVDLLIYD